MTQQIHRPVEAVASINDLQIPAICYCLYVRKSIEAEERQALSIDSQLKKMSAIAERDKISVVTTKTEAHSAKTAGQREVSNQIISEIKEGK